jgi:hypothetical protein
MSVATLTLPAPAIFSQAVDILIASMKAPAPSPNAPPPREARLAASQLLRLAKSLGILGLDTARGIRSALTRTPTPSHASPALTPTSHPNTPAPPAHSTLRTQPPGLASQPALKSQHPPLRASPSPATSLLSRAGAA